MHKKNSFTDALDKELSGSKILSQAKKNAKAKTKTVEEEIFLVEDKPQENFKIENKPQENIDLDDKTEEITVDYTRYLIDEDTQTKKIAKDPDFERRVLAEADNDFFEEKQPENIGDNFRSRLREKKSRPSNFHNETFKEISDDTPKETSPPQPNADLRRKLTRPELTGIGISAIAMFYSFSTLDKPLFFLALSLFTHLMRPLIGAFFGKYNRAVQNGLRSFSIALFAGALLLLFMLS